MLLAALVLLPWVLRALKLLVQAPLPWVVVGVVLMLAALVLLLHHLLRLLL